MSYRVKPGAEHWDYEHNPPTRETTEYIVTCNGRKVKSFTFLEDAVMYRDKMNKKSERRKP
jgi:hypothetical protein